MVFFSFTFKLFQLGSGRRFVFLNFLLHSTLRMMENRPKVLKNTIRISIDINSGLEDVQYNDELPSQIDPDQYYRSLSLFNTCYLSQSLFYYRHI